MDKLSIYEILSWIVPGTLLVGFVGLLFPEAATFITALTLPDAFKVTFLVALALFAGQIAQAIASIIEPALYWTWGGRPSEIALTKGLGDRYLPKDSATRIRLALQQVAGNEASDRSLFLLAMQRAESVPDSKAKSFNALYAYHRVLFTLVAIFIVVFTVAWISHAIPSISRGQGIAIFCGIAALDVLLWHRTRQRAYYYAREVLLAAERLLAPSSVSK